jgi:ribonuclease HII
LYTKDGVEVFWYNNEVKIDYIVGIDEVGRGPIAGPVMVGAFMCQPDFFEKITIDIPLRDSKKLTKKQREKWFEYLKNEKHKGNCNFAVSAVSVIDIDKIGIVLSIQKALNNSLMRITTQEMLFVRSSDEGGRGARPSQKVSPATFHIFLDGGLKAPVEYVNQETIIKGDELHPVING